MANTIDYQQEWALEVQERLSDPALWNIINDVRVVNGDVLNNPYETHASYQTHTRGSAYTHQAVTFTNETATVNQSVILPQFIDRVDLIQSRYADLMKLARQQGISANEKLDALMLAAHAGWTDFGTLSIGGGGAATDPITLSISNVGTVIDGVTREIHEAKGLSLASRNGVFFIWRPADFEIVTRYARSQGFSTADDIILNGMRFGMKYMGVEHYLSNQHTANHVFAGVKKTFTLGIASGTFPMVYEVDEPTAKEAGGNEAGNLSAKSIVTRIDHVYKAFANFAPVLFDINVV